MNDTTIDFLFALFVAGVVLLLGGRIIHKVGKESGRCEVRWEYATTATDSLAIYRERPECVRHD